MEDEAEDPKSQPIVWVSKWVDYSDKYGFGYSLNDDSIGNVFIFIRLVLILMLKVWSSTISPSFCYLPTAPIFTTSTSKGMRFVWSMCEGFVLMFPHFSTTTP